MKFGKSFSSKYVAILAYVTALTTGSARGQHQGDVWIGVTPGGQLAVSTYGFVPADNYAALDPVDGLIKGWSDSDPGFDRVVAVPDVDPLASGAAIWLEVVSADPAFQVIDDAFQFLHDPGDDTLLGGSNLHEHLTWHINNQDPAFDPTQCVWHATFVLRDDGTTGYATSEPLEFSFSTEPVRAAGIPADGDFDGDGTIADADFAALAACLDGGGPLGIPQPDAPGVTTCEVACVNAFDFDDDRDVDLRDAAAMQRAIP
jgi:hypothetical protein